MSAETLTLIFSGIAAGAALATVVYGEIQRRKQNRDSATAQEGLRLAREQAALRPEITVYVEDDLPVMYVPPAQRAVGGTYEADIQFKIKNTGKSAAHNVVCKFEFDKSVLEPVDYGDFSERWARPEQVYDHDVKLRTHFLGPTTTTIKYTAICDEVGEKEGTLRIEVA